VDDLSGGRLQLGLGAGWQQREHDNFGLDLLPIPERFQRFEEGLEVITRLLQTDGPVTYHGDYYRLKEAVLLPRPARAGGPPILIGGNGPERTLPLAARFASEWNAVFVPPQRFETLSERLNRLLAQHGRAPESVRRSLMTGCFLADSDGALNDMLTRRNVDLLGLRERGLVVGTAPQVVDQITELGASGVERVMLQWLNLDDRDGIRRLGRDVAARFQR
jgi:alkanesulfonate monooxygenase SsuD/methylene tetrahydromethanopterin reductase-like flavin-dependent oxidoreductase (luciferase family)